MVRAFSEEAVLHEAVLALRLDPRRTPHRRHPVLPDHPGWPINMLLLQYFFDLGSLGLKPIVIEGFLESSKREVLFRGCHDYDLSRQKV